MWIRDIIIHIFGKKGRTVNFFCLSLFLSISNAYMCNSFNEQKCAKITQQRWQGHRQYKRAKMIITTGSKILYLYFLFLVNHWRVCRLIFLILFVNKWSVLIRVYMYLFIYIFLVLFSQKIVCPHIYKHFIKISI